MASFLLHDTKCLFSIVLNVPQRAKILMCLLFPVGFVTAFDTLYQSVLFVICFDKEKLVVSCLMCLSSSVWK